MKIKLNYNQLTNELMPSLADLSQKTIKDIDTLMKVVDNARIVDNEVQKYSDLHDKIATQNCIKGDDGKPVFENGNQLKYNSAQDQIDVYNKIQELRSKEVELELKPLKRSELEDIGDLKPKTILGLGQLFES